MKRSSVLSSPRALPTRRRKLVPLIALAVALGPAGCSDREAPSVDVETVTESQQALTCLTFRRGSGAAVEDATIGQDPTDPSIAATNFGSALLLTVGSSGPGTRRSLVRFDLSAIAPTAAVVSATLSLFKQASPGGGTSATLHRITAPWSEPSVTWSGLGGAFDPTPAATIALTASPNGTTHQTDITALVQSWVSGAYPNEGLLIDQSTGRTTFGSSEAGAANPRPTLSVCFGPATCGNGIQDGAETGVDCGGPCAPCSACSGVVCTAQDACHLAGACNPATGQCSQPLAPWGTACDDGDACTTVDTCQQGVCAGQNPTICSAQDACHAVGTCDPLTGSCDNPAAPDGTTCDDGDACTAVDVCLSGLCLGSGNACATCSDGIQNQDETGVDCGGSICPACAVLPPPMPVPPSEFIEFAVTPNTSTSQWDLTGHYPSGITNTMTWDSGEIAWKAAASSSTYIDTAWKPSGGAKTACMWKKWYDGATLGGNYGLDGYQIAGNYFYYGSYFGLFYFYSGSAGGNASNQGVTPTGPSVGSWTFTCVSSGGASSSTQYYAATPGAASPILYHNQASNGGDPGHTSDALGMRYGVLYPSNNHPSAAYYGGFIHFDAQLSAAELAQVYQATKIYYPGHGGSRNLCAGAACSTCSDGVQNQDEAGVDCGGSVCPTCTPSLSVPPAQFVEFALRQNLPTSQWDLSGQITSGLANTMTWDQTNKAWTGQGSSSTYIDSAWKPNGGTKTACMWKKWYDAATLGGNYGLDGYQIAGNYFYYGSYFGLWYLYSGSAGGNATNQGTSPSGPAVGDWVFSCIASSGSGGSTQFYSAIPGGGAPVLRHNQASNGNDPGHTADAGGMRYGVLWPSGNHPSKAYYGGFIHWNTQLTAAQITQAYDATKIYYPGHGGTR